MVRILHKFLDRKADRPCAAYVHPKDLYDGLGREDAAAIRCLGSRISGSVFKLGKNYKLVDEDIEELICDCITVFLQKIRLGQYTFQGFDPASYVIEIAKNKAKNFQRSFVRHQTVDLDSAGERAEEPGFGSFAETELLTSLLNRLNPNCQNLIRLKYLDELRDKEVIERKLTQYTTVDALKNHRAQCLKKLVEFGMNTSLYDSLEAHG